MMKTGEIYLSEITERIDDEIPFVDFHIHTNWTDGLHSVREMYEQASRLKLESILFSEHARKYSSDWFPQFSKEVRNLPRKPCIALVGVEARAVDFNGNLDLSPEILSHCDLVIGSVHRFPGKDGDPLSFDEIMPDEALDIESRLAEALLYNPEINILGHPFGMCYAQFGIIPQEKMILRLAEKAAKNNVAFEINSRYHPDPWRLIQVCKTASTQISLGSDAHSTDEVGIIVQVLKGEKANGNNPGACYWSRKRRWAGNNQGA